jgi:hypothetical protein
MASRTIVDSSLEWDRSGGSALGSSAVLTGRRRQEMYWLTSALRAYAWGLVTCADLCQRPSILSSTLCSRSSARCASPVSKYAVRISDCWWAAMNSRKL